MFKFAKGFLALMGLVCMVFYGCMKEDLQTLELQENTEARLGSEVSIDDMPVARALPKGSCQCFYQVINTTSDDNDLWKVRIHDGPGAPFASDTDIYSGFDGNNDQATPQDVFWTSTAGSGNTLPTGDENQEDFRPAPNAEFDDIQNHWLDFVYWGEEEEYFAMTLKVNCYRVKNNSLQLSNSTYHTIVRPDGVGGDGTMNSDPWRDYVCVSCRPLTIEEAEQCKLTPG